jgi:photosynthetic reaction center cytochrome c subunit
MRLKLRLALALVLGTAALGWVLTVAVAASQGQGPPAAMAEQVFRNVQILKGIPVDRFMGTMGFFSAALGLNCTDCHVAESGGDWARYADDTPLKQMTRRMMLMVNGINTTNFGGRQVVTCNTCHRGTNRPNVMPSLALLYSSPPPPEPGDPFRQADGLPPADQVLDQYLQALGGPQRLAGLTSFAARGGYKGYDDPEQRPLEIFANAQGQRTTIVHGPFGDTTTTLDGRNAWIAGPLAERPLPLIPLTGQELDGVTLEAEVFFPARIKQSLTNWRVGYPTEVDGKEVKIVQGTTAGGGTATLCFDEATSLLVRMVRYAESPVGRIVTQVDYSDYRDVAGVKIPFRWTVTWLDGRSQYELTTVQPNVGIEAARFATPAPSRPPANPRP